VEGNTALGSGAEVSVGFLSNATALGNVALVNSNDKVVIGGNIAGMVIGGYANWSNLSDGRFKEDVQENVPGLSFINQLRPVTYWINTDKLQRHITREMPDSLAQHFLPTMDQKAKDKDHIHTGFIAQEVEALAKQIGYDFDGVHIPKDPTDNYSIAYSQFVPSLVKAVQEQQAEIERLGLAITRIQDHNNDLEVQNTHLKNQVDRLEQLEAEFKKIKVMLVQ
jgi:hypothetical protein